MASKPTPEPSKEGPQPAPPALLGPIPRDEAYVFISHDHRDSRLAEAFADLLTDASGGIVRSFRSSDKKADAGIEFGDRWFDAIMQELANATDVIAILTANSLDRPWILFEAGVARGKLNTKVFGVALGVTLARASSGPFAQFQNCGGDEDDLAKLVTQIVKHHPRARPREEAVKRAVRDFLQRAGPLIPRAPIETAEQKSEEPSVVQMFQEIKLMYSDLPSRIEEAIKAMGFISGSQHHGPKLSATLAESFIRGLSSSAISEKEVALQRLADLIRDAAPSIAQEAERLSSYLSHAAPEDGERRFNRFVDGLGELRLYLNSGAIGRDPEIRERLSFVEFVARRLINLREPRRQKTDAPTIRRPASEGKEVAKDEDDLPS